jgi:molybdate transport system substrate-binding protein
VKLTRSSFGPLMLAAALSLAILAPLASPAAAAPAQQATVTVFAASSLTDAFKEIGQAFEAEKSTPVTFNFAASSALRTQIEQGASADVFASADQANMDSARKANLINGADITFARNRLIAITPKNNPAGIQSVADIARPGVKFVTAAPEVPIGTYTQNMFDKMSTIDVFGPDFKDRANANIVSRETNVRQVVSKVQLGEADVAVCYFTDVTPQAAPDLLMIPIPDDLNTLATYPIAIVNNAPQGELGQAFIDTVTGPVGQAILQKWNFGTVGPTMLMPRPTTDRLALVTAAR